MERIKIDSTDVILEDLGEGKGKIIISDLNVGSFSYFWGSMGSNLKEFLLRINEGYFADKLLSCEEMYVFDGKATVKSIRKHLRENMDLPWYSFRSAQKEMREQLKDLESCRNENEFIECCTSLPDSLYCFDLNHSEEKEFKEIISDIFKCEPWNFIETKTSYKHDFMCNLLKDLKKELKKSSNDR